MKRRLLSVVLLIAVAPFIGLANAEDKPKSDKPKPTAEVADVTGDWTGTWGQYDPAKSSAVDKALCKLLDCKVVQKDGVWQATFEGECGRPYKYTIKMEGRQVGSVVLFKGTTDLGEKDGGVFDWVGRATDKEFVGFYTSGHYTGVFQLTRKK